MRLFNTKRRLGLGPKASGQADGAPDNLSYRHSSDEVLAVMDLKMEAKQSVDRASFCNPYERALGRKGEE